MACVAEQINGSQTQTRLFVKPNIGDDMIAVAYLRMKAEGLIPVIFYEGDPGLRWFLDWFHRTDTVCYGCFLSPRVDTGENQTQLCGLLWVDTIITLASGHKKANSGVMFFRDYQKGNLPLQFGELVLDAVFSDLKIDVLWGTTPVPNRIAKLFTMRLGYKYLPPCPMFCSWEGKVCDAAVCYLTKQMWQEQRGK